MFRKLTSTRTHYYVNANFSEFGGVSNHRAYDGKSRDEAVRAAARVPGLLSHVGVTGPVLIEILTHNFGGAGSRELKKERFVYWVTPAQYMHEEKFLLLMDCGVANPLHAIDEIRSKVPADWLA